MIAMKKQILFIDDEVNFLEGIRLMLRRQRNEWELTFVESVDEALAKIDEVDFDAIVCDVSMPLRSGLDFLEALREDKKARSTPVIILTGNAETDLKRRALDFGATDLLNKPIHSEDLIARLRSVLRLRAYQDQLEAYNETLELKVQERTRDLEYSRRDMIWRLAKAGEYRDEETGEHVIRVACCSRLLAESLGMDSQAVNQIFLTSSLHDIGKIGVPDSVLLKDGPLDEEERAIIERHCEIGASILQSEPRGMSLFQQLPGESIEQLADPVRQDSLRDMAVTIAMSHHERWDGAGYPKGLKGDDIPVAGRIVALSDVFDALRSERPYKRTFATSEVTRILRESSGTCFDPAVFDEFDKRKDDFEEIRREHAS